MTVQMMKIISGVIVDELAPMSFASVCHCCHISSKELKELVRYGIVEPLNSADSYSQWQFPSSSILRVQTANRLQRDLGVNAAGAALALELLDEVKALRRLLAYR